MGVFRNLIMVALLGAIREETDCLLREMMDLEELKSSPSPQGMWKGRLAGHEVLLVRSGIGKERAETAGRYVLENIGLSEYEAAQAEQTFYHHDRKAVRDLAELWVPGMPIAENKKYIERSQALEKDLETALLELAEEHAKKSA